MKLKILNLIPLLFLQAICIAQTDSLVFIKQSRVAFCNSKIEQVAILKARIEVKEVEVALLEERIKNKETEVVSLNNSNNAFIAQLAIRKVELKELKDQIAPLEKQIKQLRKENRVLKIGVVGLIVLTVYSWISG